jgi:hypothetical protein
MAASDRDREHFRKLGEAKEQAHREALEAHLALPLEERLERSWALYLRFRDPNAPERDDDPTPFYDRARALGLYQG